MRRLIAGVIAAAAVIFAMPGIAQEAHQFSPARANLLDRADWQSPDQHVGRKMYVVQMVGESGIGYDGGLDGFAATAPAAGGRYNAQASHVQQYTSHLIAMHDDKLASIGAAGRKAYSYSHTMNGFAAMLTAGEVSKLRRDKAVLNVFEDFSMPLDTNNSPTFLGLNDRREGLRKRQGLKGEDVIVGVLDSGVVQEHPSFTDTRTFDMPRFCDDPRHRFIERICNKLERYRNQVVYDAPPAHWAGECVAGEAFSEDDCNNKLIGARYYNAGFLAGEPTGIVEGDFLSARDADGHGSHTASTAAGNYVTASLNGIKLDRISGMAPRARVAIYKVCWAAPDPDDDGCFFSDSAAATDQAVVDGVDVLNFSVGTAQSFVDTQDLAFLDAAAAGVFVARSSGNAGPGPGSTAAGEPWVMSVGASTLSGNAFALAARVNSPASVAGDYAALEGAITGSLRDLGPITDDLVAAEPIDACAPLSNSDVTMNSMVGKIALIARGTCAFTTKIEAAANAGALAVLMYSDNRDKTVMGGTTTALTLSIPGVMIDNAPGVALLGELTAGNTVNATLAADIFTTEELEGNIMADFSSRGPYTTESDWVKPDITAPGVRILAASAPDQAHGGAGDLFAYLQGTSMSSPHIAGLGALVKEAHPDWSAAQIKSALMTTARQDVVKEDGVTPADPFDFGAGHVDPNGAVDPGLTYDVGLLDYLVASCGTVTPLLSPADCEFVQDVWGLSIEPADLNLPSIGIGELLGTQTVTRTVTAVEGFKRSHGYGWGWRHHKKEDNGPTPYHAKVEAPEGYAVHVSPDSLSLNPGESASYELTVSNESAPPNEWRFGAVTWVDSSGHEVRSPIAVNGIAIVAPDEVDGTGTDGSLSFDVSFGYDGPYSAEVSGIEASFAGAGNSSVADPVQAWCVDLPANSHFRTALFDEETSDPGNDDLDLELFYLPGGCGNFAGFAFIGGSYSPTTEEAVDLANGPAGGYHVQVYYFAASNGNDSDYSVWFQPVFGNNGNTVVTAPAAATPGDTGTVTVDYTGLLPTRNLGALHHLDGNGEIARTILDIDAR